MEAITASSVSVKDRLNIRSIGHAALIVTSILVCSPGVIVAADPPSNLLRKLAEREAANANARSNYTYRQVFTLQELNTHGNVIGEYKEVRDVIFSPGEGRSEHLSEPARNTLTEVKLSPEDFSDVRNVNSLLLTPDKLFLYDSKFKGEENVDGQRCFVVGIHPKQILSGQRYFDGLLWVRQSDYAVVRSSGQAVPQIETLEKQNLFPHFATIRKPVDGQWLFPAETVADETLQFRDWPIRVRITIEYSNYKRFGSESTITYEGVTPPPANPPASQPAPPATTPASPATPPQ